MSSLKVYRLSFQRPLRMVRATENIICLLALQSRQSVAMVPRSTLGRIYADFGRLWAQGVCAMSQDKTEHKQVVYRIIIRFSRYQRRRGYEQGHFEITVARKHGKGRVRSKATDDDELDYNTAFTANTHTTRSVQMPMTNTVCERRCFRGPHS